MHILRREDQVRKEMLNHVHGALADDAATEVCQELAYKILEMERRVRTGNRTAFDWKNKI
jgi:hypothetical protein